jgi:CxxC motif-containing protein (DUF1111 family)
MPSAVLYPSRVYRVAWLGLLGLVHCSSAPGIEVPPPSDDSRNPLDVPIAGAAREELVQFEKGRISFGVSFVEAEGLGPLFIRSSCGGCHGGPTEDAGLVQKMAVVQPDGPPADDQSKLPYGSTARPEITAGATTPILPPSDPDVRTTMRVGFALFGRGYVEAVDGSELERLAFEQSNRGDAIGGRVNDVVYASEPNPNVTFGAHARGDELVGRFGWKARIATLDDFTADALQGDMGITNPLRPHELPNPDGLLDDHKLGIDVGVDFVNDVANYLRLIAIPPRRGLTEEGRRLFDSVTCGVCHVPSLRTRADYPISALRSIAAPIYSDLLLHDMGRPLADGLSDGDANWREWRTPPLIGLRFKRNYLHDGRASSIEEAIELHAGSGSEAGGAVRRFRQLSDSDRAVLLAFVSAL